MRRSRFLVVWALGLSLIYMSCRSSVGTRPAEVHGETMGTTYTVKYQETDASSIALKIQDVLRSVNAELNTYSDTSFISRFNASQGGLPFVYETAKGPLELVHFQKNFDAARRVFQASGGAFDPTVSPLVNYWGFGYTHKGPPSRIDSARIDSLRQIVGFEQVMLKDLDGQLFLLKTDPRIELDFSAIAKGYAVDAISEMLTGEGISAHFVEIGGEVRTRGKKPNGDPWVIGINKPQEGAAIHDALLLIQLEDLALASSGNYRNVYTFEGRKYSHTIHPKHGFPERNDLLGVSVVANTCMEADAYATACMVLGLEEAQKLIERTTDVEACFIYSDAEGEMQIRTTERFKSYQIDNGF